MVPPSFVTTAAMLSPGLKPRDCAASEANRCSSVRLHPQGSGSCNAIEVLMVGGAGHSRGGRKVDKMKFLSGLVRLFE